MIEQGEVEAAGQKAINEARNALSAAIIDLEITKERLRVIPAALAEAVKPLEKIGDVKIIDFGGRGMPLNGAPAGAAAGAGNGAGNPAENLVNALMQYRLQSPLIDQLLAQAGLHGPDPLKAALGALSGGQAPAKPAAE